MAAHPERREWVRPGAGTIGFPRLLTAEPIDSFTARLVETAGVLLVPGTVYGHGGNHFRLGVGRTDLPESLARFEAFLTAG